MSMMRSKERLEPETADLVTRTGDCGPRDGIWKDGLRYWICDYHEGFDDGVAVGKGKTL